MATEDILSVTKLSPSKVRPHGPTRSGAFCRSWVAIFPRYSAPQPGFRLFDESGVALIHLRRKQIEKYKRCLRFHATRGCSHTPACLNCGSTMHLLSKCKAPSCCRKFGGLHRSDSRKYLSHLSRAGPAAKKQLAIIQKMSQREYHAVVRAEAAFLRAAAAAKVSVKADMFDAPIPNGSSIEEQLSRTFRVPLLPSPQINFLFINLGKGGTTHDIALSPAYELNIDIVMIWELWWSNRTKSHTYNFQSPFGRENIRPRAITYTRRNNKEIIAKQFFLRKIPPVTSAR